MSPSRTPLNTGLWGNVWSVSFLGLLCRMPVPILKHRLELQGISHVASLVSFSDVKAFEVNNFTGFTPKRRLNHRRVFRCSLCTYTVIPCIYFLDI